MIRFYGSEDLLKKWRLLIKQVTGQLGTEPAVFESTPITTFTFEVELSAEQRELVQDKLWYAESGFGDLKWNSCVSYLDLNRPKRRRTRTRQ